MAKDKGIPCRYFDADSTATRQDTLTPRGMTEPEALGREDALSRPRGRSRVRPPAIAWPLARYALAPISTAICLLLGLGFYRDFKSIPFMPFVPAIAICAGFGGLGPGMLALALSAAGATYLFALEDFVESPTAQLAFFMASAAVITVLSTMLRHACRSAGAARHEAHLAQDAAAEANAALSKMIRAHESELNARIGAAGSLDSAPAKCVECRAITDSNQQESLTPRELEVLGMIAEGLTNAAAAQRLIISPYTVNMHLRSIYAKLGVSSRSAAVRCAFDRKLI
jgi:DNA-binding CsgD family transcriptional regulator